MTLCLELLSLDLVYLKRPLVFFLQPYRWLHRHQGGIYLQTKRSQPHKRVNMNLLDQQQISRRQLFETCGVGVGKIVLIMEFMHTVVHLHQSVSVFAGIGERIREGHELSREMQAAGVMPQALMVFGQMDESPGARLRADMTAPTTGDTMPQA